MNILLEAWRALQTVVEDYAMVEIDGISELAPDSKYRMLQFALDFKVDPREISIEENEYTEFSMNNPQGAIKKGTAKLGDKNGFLYLDPKYQPNQKSKSIKSYSGHYHDKNCLKCRVHTATIIIKPNNENIDDPYIIVYTAWGHTDIPHGGNPDVTSPFNPQSEAMKKAVEETHCTLKNLKYADGCDYLYFENSGFVRKNIPIDKNWMHYYTFLFTADWISGEPCEVEDLVEKPIWRWMKLSELLQDNTCRIKRPVLAALRKNQYIK